MHDLRHAASLELFMINTEKCIPLLYYESIYIKERPQSNIALKSTIYLNAFQFLYPVYGICNVHVHVASQIVPVQLHYLQVMVPVTTALIMREITLPSPAHIAYCAVHVHLQQVITVLFTFPKRTIM